MRCPSVQVPGVGLVHEKCEGGSCTWWEKKCTAVDTIPLGNLTKKLRYKLAPQCRWARQSKDGVCPPMTHGTLCEHQGGDFNTFDFEEYGQELAGDLT